ncbi:hypothetical protein GKE73_05790 [Paludibacterium sp. dN 18-1]|uniref:Flagellar protein FlgJ N-terminal domain-containing protein n=2 Tax=Paludibacterium denitrificans TaxID=2675226 RepID=A0A844GEB9_9NEIS|nr:hypothetical protein [Paludibacterium denitrificans]
MKMEGLFITQMLKEMRKSTEQISPEGSIFKDKIGTDMLDLADTMVADSMASQRAFGIADMVVRQLTLPASVSANPAMPFPLNPRERS